MKDPAPHTTKRKKSFPHQAVNDKVLRVKETKSPAERQQLLGEVYEEVRRYTFKIINDRHSKSLKKTSHTAEDLLHDTFFDTVENYNEEKKEKNINFATYLIFKMRRHLTDIGVRKETKFTTRFAKVKPPSSTDRVFDLSQPEIAATRPEDKKIIDQSLRKLPPILQDALYSWMVGEKSKDHAKAIGVPHITVRTRKHHALKKMRRLLEPKAENLGFER